jgi:hypothetical protein
MVYLFGGGLQEKCFAHFGCRRPGRTVPKTSVQTPWRIALQRFFKNFLNA